MKWEYKEKINNSFPSLVSPPFPLSHAIKLFMKRWQLCKGRNKDVLYYNAKITNITRISTTSLKKKDRHTLEQIFGCLVTEKCMQQWSAQVFRYCSSIKLSKSQQAQKNKRCCCLLSCYFPFLLPSAVVPLLHILITLSL